MTSAPTPDAVPPPDAVPDAGDSPAALAAGIDAVLDEVADALAAGDVGTASALVTAASSTSDALLDALAVPDVVDADDAAGVE